MLVAGLALPRNSQEEVEQYFADLRTIAADLPGTPQAATLRGMINAWLPTAMSADVRQSSVLCEITSRYVDFVEMSKLVIAGNVERLRLIGLE